MNFIADFVRSHATTVPTVRLCFVLLACAAVAAAQIATLRPGSVATPSPRPPMTAPKTTTAPPDGPAMPRTEFAPTFEDAAESLRSGRYADAYGRFVRLADEGDVDAARMALVMHALGPKAFGSAWDATVEQLAEWTRWSEAAAKEDLGQLRAALQGHGVDTSAKRQAAQADILVQDKTR